MMCLKLKWPEKVTLLRGHWDIKMTMQMYAFETEVLKKYGNVNVFNDAVDLMDYFGITAVIEGKIFCVNGGPDPGASTLDQV